MTLLRAALFLILPFPGVSEAVSAALEKEPPFYLARPGALQEAKERISREDPILRPAYLRLMEDAARALKQKPLSVMDKPVPGPSGDKHDYFSLAPYYWPDPAKEDGLPYLRRDGKINSQKRNPEFDAGRMGKMAQNLQVLALAYYFTGEEKYAERCALFIRVWFLDPETRMNPSFNYAQAVPGVTTGRCTGLIESRSLRMACDAAGLIANSTSWRREDQEGLVRWITDFMRWMQSSPHGLEESEAPNNHGTFYDAQLAHFALFVGDGELARERILYSKLRRLPNQILPDGSQPLELARVEALRYSQFNLQAYFDLAILGEYLGIDLWNYATSDGAGIRKAVEYVLDRVEQQETDAGEGPEDPPRREFLIRAWHAYRNERCFGLWRRSSAVHTERDLLLFPITHLE